MLYVYLLRHDCAISPEAYFYRERVIKHELGYKEHERTRITYSAPFIGMYTIYAYVLYMLHTRTTPIRQSSTTPNFPLQYLSTKQAPRAMGTFQISLAVRKG